MQIGAFEIREPVPQLTRPHALTTVRPWVDVGSVGTLTLNRLERQFEARELGRLARPGNFFDFTRYRPMIRNIDGRREVTVPNSIVHYAQPPGGPDFLFLHLLEPHAQGECYIESVLELLKYFEVSTYCRVGSMYDAVPHTRPLLVTGSTGSLLPPKGCTIPIRRTQGRYEGPTTIMGMVAERVHGLQMNSMNFLVHIPQYVQLEEDYAGMARMVDVLSAMYDLPKDLALTERGERQYKELNPSVERNPDLRALISQLEAYYDSRNKKEGDTTGLAPEIEQFLQSLGGKLDAPGT
jgi:hypothetical protein